MTGRFNITKIATIFQSRDLFCVAQELRYEFPDGDLLRVPLLHRADANGNARTLGFLTDFASKPWLAQLMVDDRCDEGVPAYIGHDWLYCAKKISRCVDGRWIEIAIDQDYADDALLEMCLALGMDRAKADEIYIGVTIGGASHFNARPAINLDDITPEHPTEDFAVLTVSVIPSMEAA